MSYSAQNLIILLNLSNFSLEIKNCIENEKLQLQLILANKLYFLKRNCLDLCYCIYSSEEGQYEIKKPIDLLIIATKRLL